MHLFLVIPILRFAALELKKLYISYLLPVTLPITALLMQSFSEEKCAGIHAFIYESSVFYFLCLFCLPLFGVCPSSSKEIENAQKI
mmetsp:Transcript_6824/g.7905  ORF Transcript_6824/g.7905 Transcript_6824/m.7905 type:complete len:86 (-) Transcript_6824:125-382(-)